MSFLKDLNNAKLRSVQSNRPEEQEEQDQTKKMAQLKQLIEAENKAKIENEIRREYFFRAAVDQWYDKLTHLTFPSDFVTLSRQEAQCIIDYWQNITAKIELSQLSRRDAEAKLNGTFSSDFIPNEIVRDIPNELSSLVERIEDIIQTKFNNDTENKPAVFIKLSTRSPKDSKTIFRKAEKAFNNRLDENGNLNSVSKEDQLLATQTSRGNARLVAFSDEMARANAVSSGFEAVRILLDSHRVAEDLMYAIGQEEGEAATTETSADKKEFNVSVVVRGWDRRICPKVEYRAFVWDYELTAIGQYWHSLYYPDLKAIAPRVARDILAVYNREIKQALPVPCAMLDIAWLGDEHDPDKSADIILIEVNPLMEGLGSFKGSTGLFDYYEDQGILTGKEPVEIRVREVEESKSELISHMSPQWRRIVFEY